MDLDAILNALTDDVHYHNIPMEPLHGRDAVANYLKGAWKFDECEWRLLNVAVRADTVLTERIDEFVFGGQRVSLPVMGVFVVRDGQIAAWRDYFDLADYRRQLEQVTA